MRYVEEDTIYFMCWKARNQ